MRRSRLSSLVANRSISASIFSRAVEPTTSSRRARAYRSFSSILCTFAAAHQDFVLDETLKLTDGLLKVPLFTLLDIALIDKHRLVHRLVRASFSDCASTVASDPGPSVACNRRSPGSQRWIYRSAVNHGPCNDPLYRLEPCVIDQNNANDSDASGQRSEAGRRI